MKKIIIAALLIFSVQIIEAQTPQEPTTFVKHDTAKIVLHAYEDSVTLKEVNIKSYIVVEVRKGDRSGQYYSLPKGYLNEEKKPFVNPKFTVISEVPFGWKQSEYAIHMNAFSFADSSTVKVNEPPKRKK